MKLLVLALVVVVVSAGDREHHKLKKWAMMKAMEGCFGPEAMRQYMVKVKSSAAKCMRIDAPELDLPIFKNPVRVVNALSQGAYDPSVTHSHPHTHFSGQGGSLDQLLKHYLVKKIVSEFLDDDFPGSDDDGDLSATSNFRPALRGNFRRRMHQQFRFKRQADNQQQKEMFELGDRLNAKLQEARERMESRIGNFTCMLRECGVIDASNNLVGVEQLKEQMEEFPVQDDWLRERINDDIETCHAFAEAVPQRVLDDCVWGPELAKVKMYKKCLKMHKLRTCMNYDVKQKLESNFNGSLEDLVETTQMEEDELLPLVMTFLAPPEVDL